MDLSALTYDRAKDLEGTEFRIELAGGTVASLRLDEVSKADTGARRQRQRAAAPRREAFSLYFLGPVNPVLPQGMYTFRSDAETFEALFIVPVGQDDEATEYEAVFT